jgi:lipoprotein-anchoring transpeptidase ErfK/SrfK
MQRLMAMVIGGSESCWRGQRGQAADQAQPIWAGWCEPDPQPAITSQDRVMAPIGGGRLSSWVLAVAAALSMTAGAPSPAAAPTVAHPDVLAAPATGGEPIVGKLNMLTDQVYGVGMPVVLTFNAPVPLAVRAQVQSRLSVRSEPPQTGAWRWYGDQQVIYRPRQYWRAGTRLTVHTALGGHSVDGQSVGTGHTVTARIGGKQTIRIDHDTKQLQVFQNDRLVKTYPASLGKPETPSSTGRMVVMERLRATDWVYSATDTLHVEYAERLTADGEFIHAAPWSVGDQGHNNVSHGCTNLSTTNAAWIYQHTHVGDPVTVVGTEKHLAADNGWTVWDTNWSDYVKGPQ